MSLATLREKLIEARTAAAAGDTSSTVQSLDQALQEIAPDHLLTTTEAAELLGVRSVNTVKLWCRSGYLCGVKRGGRTMIPVSEVERIRDSDYVRTARILDELDEDIGDFGVEEGLTDEQLQDLSASRPGRLPWQVEANTKRDQ